MPIRNWPSVEEDFELRRRSIRSGMTGGSKAVALALSFVCAFSCVRARPASAEDAAQTSSDAAMTMEMFLDRMMMVESGGRDTAKNPRSTALGPYQFIASTWLMIARADFSKETEKLRPDEILALRTDRALARRAAEIYTKQNAAFLVNQGQKATYQNLRLAFLVGPGAAVRVLMSAPDRSASELLGTTVIGANPFMANMTAAGLIARAARDIATTPANVAGVTPEAGELDAAKRDVKLAKANRPRIAVACELSLPSCKRWLALAERRLKRIRRASN